jgi:hypothetical protein
MQMAQREVFRHARWRLLILGAAGAALGPLMLWQSWDMLDPGWHTEASRGAWFNQLPPMLRAALMAGPGLLLSTIAVADIWIVLGGKAALILDQEGLTMRPVLQRSVRVLWREIVGVEQGKAMLVLHRRHQKPIVIGYDWLDARPTDINSAVKGRWHAAISGST